MTVIAAVGNPVTDNPILSFSLGLFGILVAAFVVGALLLQSRFRPVWCFAACEAFFLLSYFYSVIPLTLIGCNSTSCRYFHFAYCCRRHIWATISTSKSFISERSVLQRLRL
jgi:hypothetical protein